jgi:hypothetical protein
MILWRSFRKSRNLARWSQVLGSDTALDAHEETLAEVFAFCESEPALAKVVRLHGERARELPRPNHEVIRFVNNGLKDFQRGPGENNEFVKAGRGFG